MRVIEISRQSWDWLKTSYSKVAIHMFMSLLLAIVFSTVLSLLLWGLSSYQPFLFFSHFKLLGAYGLMVAVFFQLSFLALGAAFLTSVHLNAEKASLLSAFLHVSLLRSSLTSFVLSLLPAILFGLFFQQGEPETLFFVLGVTFLFLLPVSLLLLQVDSAFSFSGQNTTSALKWCLQHKTQSMVLFFAYLFCTVCFYTLFIFAWALAPWLALLVELVFVLVLWPYIIAVLMTVISPISDLIAPVEIKKNTSQKWQNPSLLAVLIVSALAIFVWGSKHNQSHLRLYAQSTEQAIQQEQAIVFQRSILGDGVALEGNGAIEYLNLLNAESLFVTEKLPELSTQLEAFDSEQTAKPNLEKILSQYTHELETLRRAGQYKQINFPVDYSINAQLPSLLAARSLAKLLSLQADMLMQSGQTQSAILTYLQALRFGQDISSHPTLISHMVARALILDQARLLEPQISPELLKQIDLKQILKEYDKLLKTPLDIRRALNSERLTMSRLLLNMGKDVFAVSEMNGSEGGLIHQMPAWLREASSFWFQPYLLYTHILHNAYWDSVLNRLDAGAVALEVDEVLQKQLEGNIFMAIAMPNYQQFVHKERDTQAALKGVYLSFALAEYQRQHGTCPESLQALAPVIIVDLPLDPFSGKDFIYRCDAGTYQLYSTGLNQIDDQGKEDAFSNTFEALDFVIH